MGICGYLVVTVVILVGWSSDHIITHGDMCAVVVSIMMLQE